MIPDRNTRSRKALLATRLAAPALLLGVLEGGRYRCAGGRRCRLRVFEPKRWCHRDERRRASRIPARVGTTLTPDTAICANIHAHRQPPDVTSGAGVHRPDARKPHCSRAVRRGDRIGRFSGRRSANDLLRPTSSAALIEGECGTRPPRRKPGQPGRHQVDTAAAGADRLFVGVSPSLANQIIARRKSPPSRLRLGPHCGYRSTDGVGGGYALRLLRWVAATAAE